MQEGLFHPAVQQGGHGKPVYRELQHDDISPEQAFLFGCGVNLEIRVQAVEVYGAAAWQGVFQLLHDGFVGNGIAGGVGVAADDENVFLHDIPVYLSRHSVARLLWGKGLFLRRKYGRFLL